MCWVIWGILRVGWIRCYNDKLIISSFLVFMCLMLLFYFVFFFVKGLVWFFVFCCVVSNVVLKLRKGSCRNIVWIIVIYI